MTLKRRAFDLHGARRCRDQNKEESALGLGRFWLPAPIVWKIVENLIPAVDALHLVSTCSQIHGVLSASTKGVILDHSLVEDKNQGLHPWVEQYTSIYPSPGCEYRRYISSHCLAVLFSAAARNDHEMLRLAFANPKIKSAKPWYKFNFGTYRGFCDDWGESTDDESTAGITLLQVAAEKNNAEAVEVILSSKGGGETADSMGLWGCRTLHVACWATAWKSVEVLLQHKAQVNAASMSDYSWQGGNTSCMQITPLHAALLGPLSREDFSLRTQQHTLHIVQMLVDKGADVNATTGPVHVHKDPPYRIALWGEDRGGRFSSMTALHLAVAARNELVVRFLMNNGAQQRVLAFEGVPNYGTRMTFYSDDDKAQGCDWDVDREFLEDLGGDDWDCSGLEGYGDFSDDDDSSSYVTEHYEEGINDVEHTMEPEDEPRELEVDGPIEQEDEPRELEGDEPIMEEENSLESLLCRGRQLLEQARQDKQVAVLVKLDECLQEMLSKYDVLTQEILYSDVENDTDVDERLKQLRDLIDDVRLFDSKKVLQTPTDPLAALYVKSTECGTFSFEWLPCRRLFSARALAIAAAAKSSIEDGPSLGLQETMLSLATLLCSGSAVVDALPPPNGCTECWDEYGDAFEEQYKELVGEAIERCGGTIKAGDETLQDAGKAYDADTTGPVTDTELEELYQVCKALSSTERKETSQACWVRLVASLQTGLDAETNIPIDMLIAVTRAAAIPVLRFYASLFSSHRCRSDRIANSLDIVLSSINPLPQNIRHDVEDLVHSACKGVLNDWLIFSPRDMKRIVLSASCRCDIVYDVEGYSAATGTFDVVNGVPLCDVYACAILEVITLRLLRVAREAAAGLLRGFPVTAYLLWDTDEDPRSHPFRDTAEQTRSHAKYSWMYLGSVSDSDELMQAFFPSGKVSRETVWSAAVALRKEDNSFKAWIVELLGRQNRRSFEDMMGVRVTFSTFEDFLVALKGLNLGDVIDEATASEVYTELRKTCDAALYIIEESVPHLTSLLESLHWNRSEEQQLHINTLRKLADAYLCIGHFQRASTTYVQAIENAARCCPTSDYDGDSPELVTHLCYLGLGQAHAGLGNVEESFNAFRSAFAKREMA